MAETHIDTAAPPIEGDDEKQLSSFHRADEFLAILSDLLTSASSSSSSSSNPTRLDKLQSQLRDILDEYQEQPYLLDPRLQDLVTPPIDILQASVRSRAQPDDAVQRSARLLYSYTKVRGYKTIMRYLPHHVSDVIPVVDALERAQQEAVGEDADRSQGWELRYVLLLWLSLVCMIPFALDKLQASDAGTDVAQRIIDVCLSFLESPGKERDAAAVALGKLLQRRDVYEERLPWFLSWSTERIKPPANPSAFLATGILQVLCELLKAAPANIVVPLLPRIQVILSLGDHGEEEDDSDTLRTLRKSSLVNRYRCKLAARMGLALLAGEGKEDVPAEVDAYIAQLLSGLEDKDTVVRYSAAKGLARICQRLPSDFTAQVADAVTGLFGINVLHLKDGTRDLSAVSEHTWQGACLGLAELGRRRLLDVGELGEKLEWVRRALFFDIRRGSHSIGTAVRDAACYVLWGLARASYPAGALRPFADGIARDLVTVCCLDRDVSIRRAASAAFQEGAGRMGVYPHGIDVIAKTDFFSVGIRRHAFLQSCPAVAQHEAYRLPLLDHLLSTTVVHWDPAMRELGAKAVARVAELDVEGLAPRIISRMSQHAKSRDTNVLHGALLTLAELGKLCSTAAPSLQEAIFSTLTLIPRHAIGDKCPVIVSACQLIASSCTAASLADEALSPAWQFFLDAALARREEVAHEAAALAYASVSRLRDCDEFVARVIPPAAWRKLQPHKQQSFALVVGTMHFRDPLLKQKVVRFLLKGVIGTSKHVETKRNGVASLVDLGITEGDQVEEIWQALTGCLDDYTTDQRGDVGSWVRLAALRGLRELWVRGGLPVGEGEEGVFHEAVAAVGKQTMERIDVVRAEAARTLLAFFTTDSPTHDLKPHGAELVRSHFSDVLAQPDGGHNSPLLQAKLKDPAYLFPRSTNVLLSIPTYRHAALRGLVQTLGTRTQLAQRVVAGALLDYVNSDSDVGESGYAPLGMLADLAMWAEQEWGKTSVASAIFATLSVLLDDDEVVVERCREQDEATLLAILERTLALGTRSLSKITSPARLNVTAALLASTLGAASACLSAASEAGSSAAGTGMRNFAIRTLSSLTTHFLVPEQLPTVRVAAAEKLYQVVAARWARDDEPGEGEEEEEDAVSRAEELLLETDWGGDEVGEAVQEVREGLTLSLEEQRK